MRPVIQLLNKILLKETKFKHTFDEMKRKITKQLEIIMPDISKPFSILMDDSNTRIGANLLQQHPTKKNMNLISANSRLLTPIEIRLSTLIKKCSAVIFALTEYKFLRIGSKHRLYRLQLIIMKLPNIHTIWTDENKKPT